MKPITLGSMAVKQEMDSLPQFETPTHLVGGESKNVKHQPMFTVEVALST